MFNVISWVDLASSVCSSVCIYANYLKNTNIKKMLNVKTFLSRNANFIYAMSENLVILSNKNSVFKYRSEILYNFFLPKKLLVCQKLRFQHTMAYSCHTNWTIKIKKKKIWKTILFLKISPRNLTWEYCSNVIVHLRTNCSVDI